MAQSKYFRYYTYIKPVIENKTVRSIAPYIFSLTTIAILAIFAIRPTVSTILNLQKNIENNRQTLQALETKAQNLLEAKKNLDALSPEARAKIDLALPQQPSVPTLIRSLQDSSTSVASVAALQIQPLTLIDKSIPEQKVPSGLGEVDFSYNVQGMFAELITILQNLQHTPRLVNFSGVVVSKQIDSPTVLSITGKGYYLK
ncbi:MAG: type 4a pilus biogenesis protein PilO [Candidatus Daviesbacteria bacterium]